MNRPRTTLGRAVGEPLSAARADLGNARVRFTALDRDGRPWPDPITGFGARGVSLTPAAADSDPKPLMIGPLFVPSEAVDERRLHVRTIAGVLPARAGNGSYAAELFVSRDGEWSYFLFPRIVGALVAYRDGPSVVLALSGMMRPNPSLGTLTTGFRPLNISARATFARIVEYTGDVPEVSK